jgi:hypothetical protein
MFILVNKISAALRARCVILVEEKVSFWLEIFFLQKQLKPFEAQFFPVGLLV